VQHQSKKQNLGGELFLDNGEGKIVQKEHDKKVTRDVEGRESLKITTTEQSENEHMLNRPIPTGEIT
jgi:hypothetical protein